MKFVESTSLDTLQPAERSARMALIRSKDTRPELAVRRLVHGMGYRYRLHARDLPGRPDLVFRARRKVIFVHGCFWHRHDDPNCKLARLPRSRLDFWMPKLDGNKARDERVIRELDGMGWKAITIWECQLKATASLEAIVREFLER
ncbi:MAG: very short patch repair endonuclease [Pseudochelatococcus sp.]|jgi:DNA mismatch endonuclease (patch repair protein)|uniref:very short patch repair endonuclease n=1 Tax=Pseudochelatococcus sp. TaxID=2020869 RepID=UPI003D94477A